MPIDLTDLYEDEVKKDEKKKPKDKNEVSYDRPLYTQGNDKKLPTNIRIDPRTGDAISDIDVNSQAAFGQGLLDTPLEAGKLTVEGIRAIAPKGSDLELGADYYINSVADRNKRVDEETKRTGNEGSRMVGQILGTGPIGFEKSLGEQAVTQGSKWVARANQVLKSTNGAAPNVQKVVQNLTSAQRLKNYGRSIYRGAEGGAIMGGLAPTTSNDTSQNAENVESGAILGAGINAALGPVSQAYKYGKGFLGRISGTTGAAERRVGEDLAEAAGSKIDEAQAGRKEAIANADRINQEAQKLGIKGKYSPTDTAATQDIGTTSVYNSEVAYRPELANKAMEQQQANENFAADVLKASNNPNAKTEALGDFARTNASGKAAAIESEGNKAIAQVKSQRDTAVNRLQADIDAMEAQLPESVNSDLTDTKLAGAKDKNSASAANDEILRKNIKEATQAKNDLYAKYKKAGAKVEVDPTPLADFIDSAAENNEIARKVYAKSDAAKRFMAYVDEEGNRIDPENLNLTELIGYDRMLKDEISGGFSSAQGGVRTFSGQEAEYLRDLQKQTDALIQETVDRGKVTNKNFAKAATAAEDNFAKFSDTFKQRTVPGGKTDSAVSKFVDDANTGNNPAVPETSFGKYFFKPGPEGARSVEEALKANAKNPEYAANAQDYVLGHFDDMARDVDGKFSIKAFRNELAKYKDTLNAKGLEPAKERLLQTEAALVKNQAAIESGQTTAQSVVQKALEGKKVELNAAKDLAKEQKSIVKDLTKSKLNLQKKSFESYVAKELGEKTDSNVIAKAAKSSALMKKLVDYAKQDTTGEATQALKQMYQEHVELKTIALKGGTKGDVKIKRAFLDEFADKNSETNKVLDILHGPQGAQNIRDAADVIQREAFSKDRNIMGRDIGAKESAFEGATRFLGSKFGLARGAEIGGAGKVWDALNNRGYKKVISKALSDPQYAHDLVEASRKLNSPARAEAIDRVFTGVGLRVPKLLGLDESKEKSDAPKPKRKKLNLYEDLQKEQKNEKPVSSNSSGDAKFFSSEAGDSRTVVDKVATQYKVDKTLLKTIANIESSFDPTAKNPEPGASASGLMQFTDGTWKSMVKKYGKDTGITEADKNNLEANAVMGALYTKDNIKEVKKVLNRNPSPAEVYMAHRLGTTGAKLLFKNYGSKNATMLFSPKILATIDYRGKTPKTTKEVYDALVDLYNKKKVS